MSAITAKLTCEELTTNQTTDMDDLVEAYNGAVVNGTRPPTEVEEEILTALKAYQEVSNGSSSGVAKSYGAPDDEIPESYKAILEELESLAEQWGQEAEDPTSDDLMEQMVDAAIARRVEKAYDYTASLIRWRLLADLKRVSKHGAP